MDRVKIIFITFMSCLMTFFVSLSIEIQALIVFMIVDYITGIILAAVFKNSAKTDSGAYNSQIGFKGLAKKVLMILLMLVLFYVDKIIGSKVFLTLGAIGFSINEIASILENAGQMGLKIPKVFERALDVLVSKESELD